MVMGTSMHVIAVCVVYGTPVIHSLVYETVDT